MKYSNELKLKAVKDYINGISLKEIALKYNIKAKSSILDWHQKYLENPSINTFNREKRTKTNEIRLKNKVNKYKDENKELKRKLIELEIQLKNNEDRKLLKEEQKKRIKIEKENELLKKSIASFLIGYQKINNKSYSKRQIHEIYETVNKLELLGNDAKKALNIYGVGYGSYRKWVRKGKPEYKRKYHHNAEEAVETVYSRPNGVFGAEKARLQILKEFNISISRETIIEIRAPILEKLKKELASAKAKGKKGVNTHIKYLKSDLIKGDYYSNKYLEKVGIDGTWFKKIYINGKRVKFLFLPAYDFFSSEISSYAVGKSENSKVTLEMLRGLVQKMNLFRIKKVIMHSDLGTAFTSKDVDTFCKEHNIIRSNSSTGFKGNQFVEQKHRWVKKYFYLIFGHNFKNEYHFMSSIYKFVKIFNSTIINLKTKDTPNEMIAKIKK